MSARLGRLASHGQRTAERAPTRRDALRLAAAGALTLAAAPPARAQPGTDAQTIGELLRMERRLEALYAHALERRLLEPDLALLLRDQEREHAHALERALAGLGARAPRDALPLPPLRERRGLTRVALRLEGEAIAAYLDAIATLRGTSLLHPLGSIAASEGQHEVLLRRLAGREPLG